MNTLVGIGELAVAWLPALVVVTLSILGLIWARYVVFKTKIIAGDRGGVMGQLLLTASAVVGVILAVPIAESAQEQLLSLLGLLLSAAVALSSTTFIGNAMAGLMLRAVRNFRPGDFLKVGDHFGRVTEQGLLATEIQTEDRDLTTLPNLYLVTQPVKVVRASGTIVSAYVSLG